MTERTLREKIASLPRYKKVSGGMGYQDMMMVRPDGGWLSREAVLALLDVHTAAQPAPDAVAEARDLFAFVPHNAICATAECGQPASVNFERSGVGSFYCMECFMRIAKGPSA